MIVFLRRCSLNDRRRFSLCFCCRKKRQLEGIRCESRWFPPARFVFARFELEFRLRNALSFFYLLPCVAWNPRYSLFLLLRRTPVDPSALKMYQSRAATVFCRGNLAWNLKGVVKNNACWDFSDDERETIASFGIHAFFRHRKRSQYRLLNYVETFQKIKYMILMRIIYVVKRQRVSIFYCISICGKNDFDKISKNLTRYRFENNFVRP